MSGEPAIEGGAPVRDTFLVFGSPLIEEAEIQEVVETLRSGWVGTGPRTQRFEEQFGQYIGCKHALAVNSCTAGMHLALDVLGIRRRGEVITSPVTFASTANVIVHQGATPVFVDVERDTMNLDPTKLEDAISPRTEAVIPVHLAGRPCKMDEIMDIAQRHNLFVIEDAAHCVEGWYKGRKIGNIGDIAAFSFYVTKNVTTGEGGMVTTDNYEWAEEMRIKRLHGISKDAWKRYSAEGFLSYETLYPGYKYNMTDIQASMGIHQLRRVERNLAIRESHYRTYNEAFSRVPAIITPPEQSDIKHARHLYVILLKLEALKVDRNRFMEGLKAENIGSGIHFTALHLHRYYRQAFAFKPGDFPNAEYISERTLSLPLSAKLTEADVQDVIHAVLKLIRWWKR